MPSHQSKRIKKMTVTSTAQGYFHDLNPYDFHATKQLAQQDRSRLLNSGLDVKSRAPRVTTFYTVLQDKRKNHPTKFGSVPQGPHTFPHHGLHHGIVKGYKTKRLKAFHSLILSPKAFDKVVDNEIPNSHLKADRANVAKHLYQRTHARFRVLSAMKKRNEVQEIQYAHTINRLLQLHPHGAYAYKGKGAGKNALKGKGESSNKPLAQQVDLPHHHGFNDVKGVQTRNQTILKTLNTFGIK